MPDTVARDAPGPRGASLPRRGLLKSIAATLLLGVTSLWPRHGAAAPPRRRVRPTDPDWPSAADWDELRRAVGGRLQPVVSPLADCMRNADGALCNSALEALRNPFFIQDQAGGTQQSGWLDAWTSAPSTYAVEAGSAAAVNFARTKNLRLVIKGGGHSYLGQSNAADSLLIWTRRLNALTIHDSFVPQDCAGLVDPQPAVSVGSGAVFAQLYDFVTTRHGRYVQGGGCTSVGVGGHMQTGGFGSFSKYGGLTAAGLLEAQMVTADGSVRIVNARHHADLFRALKGGGAGFGITTRLTLATHPLPDRFGFLGRTVKARSDAGFRRLVAACCGFARDALIDPHWGEQIAFKPDNSLDIAMTFQGLSDAQAAAVWAPFWRWLSDNAADFEAVSDLQLVSAPAHNWWDPVYRRQHLPDSVIFDQRPGAPSGNFWWAGNSDEVGLFLSGYESIWLPERLLQPHAQASLAAALFDASRHYATTLHFNKGLAGATPERRVEARDTMLHPDAADAFALAIIAGGQSQRYPGIPGHEPDLAAARADAAKMAAALSALRAVAPDAGSYSSEMNFFEPRWRETAWGPHYATLLATKRKYDPDGLFTGHHQVGSEFWSGDGFTPRG
jgi:FAD/FMN-containing dehydrogenase